MKGTRPGKVPRPSRANLQGDRICVAAGCATRLSIYNHRDRCWQHAEVVFPHYRGRRLAPGSG
jgi:hypothetical protein